jgi:hypothetical protein
MVRNKHLITLALLVPALLPLESCIAVAMGAGAAGAYYYQGSEKRHFEEDPVAIVGAAEEVMSDMGLTVVESAASSLDGKLLAHTARDEKIKITVEAEAEGGSMVTVRVGVADKDVANKILAAIAAELD